MASNSVEEGSIFQRKTVDVRSNARRLFSVEKGAGINVVWSYGKQNKTRQGFFSIRRPGGRGRFLLTFNMRLKKIPTKTSSNEPDLIRDFEA